MFSIYNKIKNKISSSKYISMQSIDKRNYDFYKTEKKKLIIATHCGRAGVNWIADIFDNHENCVGVVEKFPLEESFYRYCNWYGIETNHMRMIYLLQNLFINLWKKNDIIFYGSPWLSSNIKFFHNHLKPDKTWILFRNKFDNVKSFLNKGWYDDKKLVKNENFPGLSLNSKFLHHSFSRIIPFDDSNPIFYKVGQIGKISWYWETYNDFIYSQINQKNMKLIIVRLEELDQNYEFFKKLTKDLSLNYLSENKFLSLKSKVANKGRYKNEINFTKKEVSEFNMFNNFSDKFY